MPTWTTILAVEIDDLRGGTKTLRVRCRLRAPAGVAEDAIEELVQSALAGKCSYVCSKFGLLPEDFVGREAQLERELSLAAAAARRGLPTPGCEIVEVVT